MAAVSAVVFCQDLAGSGGGGVHVPDLGRRGSGGGGSRGGSGRDRLLFARLCCSSALLTLMTGAVASVAVAVPTATVIARSGS